MTEVPVLRPGMKILLERNGKLTEVTIKSIVDGVMTVV